MTFRKRSVRPNLAGKKKPADTATYDQTIKDKSKTESTLLQTNNTSTIAKVEDTAATLGQTDDVVQPCAIVSAEPSSSRKLQKRTKIMPKLKTRINPKIEPVSEVASSNKNICNEPSVVVENVTEIKTNVNDCIDVHETCDTIDTSNETSCSIQATSLSASNKTDSEKLINTDSVYEEEEITDMVDLVVDSTFQSDRKVDLILNDLSTDDKKKQVRFMGQPDDSSTHVSERQRGNTSENQDYSSQSEMESGATSLLSRKKIFKPNFGLQRRKRRLSSFSAYSSCDELQEEEDLKKKKKKLKKKTAGKKDNKASNQEPSKKVKKGVNSKTVDSERYSIEQDLSTLTMQQLIRYRSRSFKTVELKADQVSSKERVVETNRVEMKTDETPQPDDDVVAPQVMINENGEIVINQESLTIKKKVDKSVLDQGIVYEDALSFHQTHKKYLGKKWAMDETLRFYKALSQIGTDFTLMAQAFDKYSRYDLKKKFKREEKTNSDLIDRALTNRLPLNMAAFLTGRKKSNKNKNETEETLE